MFLRKPIYKNMASFFYRKTFTGPEDFSHLTHQANQYLHQLRIAVVPLSEHEHQNLIGLLTEADKGKNFSAF